jgi:hypothetical protein
LIDWGDGISDLSSTFLEFNSTTGGVTGQIGHKHVYVVEGTYSIQIEVVDDDGGTAQTSRSIEVVSVEDALGMFLTRVDEIVAVTMDPVAIKTLMDARDSIDGNNMGKALNGALDKLEKSLFQAALVKIGHAMKSLIQAETNNSVDIPGLKNILELSSESIVLNMQND